ncbi:hypothetical protein ACS0TY_023152 [Phlomoides rotata]
MRRVLLSSEEGSASHEGEKIRVGFKSQDGQSDYFRIYESTKIQELVQAFCKKRKVEYATTKFILRGKRLPYRGTVGQAGLIDQDVIEAMIDQTSG